MIDGLNVTILDPIDGGVGGIDNQLPEGQEAQYAQAIQDSLTSDIDTSCDQCVDGRSCRHNQDDSEFQTRLHVAGGGATTTFAARLLQNSIDFSQAAFESVINLATDRGFGGHARDCGAAANLPKIIRLYKGNTTVIAGLRQQLLAVDGYDFTEPFVPRGEMPDNGNWDGASIVENGLIAAASGRVVQELDDGVRADGEDIPNHGHVEVGFIFNFAEGVTVDQNALNEIDVGFSSFVVDIPRLKQLADMEAGVDRSSAEWLGCYAAMIDFQLATGLALTRDVKQVVIVQPAAAA